MRIDKVAPFYTEQDKIDIASNNANRTQLLEDFHELTKQIQSAEEAGDTTLLQELLNRSSLWSEQYREQTERENKLLRDIEQRYIKSFSGNISAILKDVKEVVDAVEKEEFIADQKSRAELLKNILEQNPNKDSEAYSLAKKLVEKSYANCYSFILRRIRVQRNALAFYEAPNEEAIAIVEKKAKSFYAKPKNFNPKKDIPEQNSFVAMLNGTATNQLTNISTRSNPPIVDAITGNATIEQGALKVFIDRYNELTGGLRTSTHKLLDACTIALTQQNNYRGKDDKLNPLVTIPLERFMELCGIPLTKPSKDKTRRKVKEDLETLYHISMEWTETSGRKTKDFAKMRVCDKIALVRGNIIFSFSMDMAKYLTNAYLMQYPMELLKVDERNPNSYHIGKKLLLHNSIDNNKRKGTANILSVKSLLEVCPDIPAYEQVMSTDRAVERRIIDRLETALNALPFIKWEYSNSKGAALTDEQSALTDYKTFSELYIHFDVLNAPDQSARLERNAKKIEAQKNKSKTSKQKKTGGGSDT